MDEKQIIPTSQVLPPKINILPMTGTPIFPGIFTPLMVTNEREVELIEHIMTEHGFVGMVLTTTADVDNATGEDLYRVGCVAKVVRKVNLPDGGINIFISTLKRFRIKKFIQKEHPITVAVEYLDDKNFESNEVRALTRSLISEMKQISENNPLFSEQMRLNMVNIDHPGKIADFITSILNIDRKEQQNVLETLDVHERMMKVLVFIRKEQELMSIQQKIMKQINEKISKSQRDYFLKEQLKAIKQELGMPVDSKSGEYQRFREAIDKLQLDEDVKEQVEQELEKFSLMDANSSEFIVTRNYLDTIVSLPWNPPPVKEVDMPRARRILDEDHYGRDIRHLGRLVTEMVHDCLHAFARLDAEEAFEVARRDRKVDDEYEAIQRQNITFMMEDPRSIRRALEVMWVVRALERIGDHAKNICEYTVYMVYGKDIRHLSLDDAERQIRDSAMERQG